MTIHKRIDTIVDVGSAAFVTALPGEPPIIREIQEMLGGIDCAVFDCGGKLAEYARRKTLDAIFVGPAGHSVKGYKMLQPYNFLLEASELVRSHHERPDGSGYPDKLRGQKIPLGAAIIAVADGFDAMTTARPYRRALSVERAARELRTNLGTQFHSAAGDSFLSMVTTDIVEEARAAAKRPMAAISAEVLESVLNPEEHD